MYNLTRWSLAFLKKTIVSKFKEGKKKKDFTICLILIK